MGTTIIPVESDLTARARWIGPWRCSPLVGRHAERGAALSVIVTESGLNKPTARRLLLALIRAGLVEQDEETRRFLSGRGSLRAGQPVIARAVSACCRWRRTG